MPWPNPLRPDIDAFFGRHDINPRTGRPTDRWENQHLTQLHFPYPMRLAWDLDVTVTHALVHREVAQSLGRIFGRIWELYGQNLEKIRAARVDRFGGAYNYRPNRGGNALSLHAWGAAIDLDPDGNGYLSARPKKITRSVCMLPKEVVAIFKEEGWAWGGDWNSPYDPMHFEATARRGREDERDDEPETT